LGFFSKKKIPKKLLQMDEIKKIVQRLKKEDTDRMLKNDIEFDKIILNYLRCEDCKLIVTGQRAIEALLPNDIPPDPIKNHFEIISDYPHKHRNEIADLLEANGYTDVQRLIYGSNPTINVKHRTRVKFYYAKTQLFNSIDVRIIEGIRYESEIMLKIKIYSQFTNPSSNIGDWKELYQINTALNKKFELETGKRKCFIVPEKYINDPEIIKFKKILLNSFLKNPKIIIVGMFGYQMLVNPDAENKINYFEVISLNIKEDIEKIKTLLGSKDILIKKTGATLNYHGPKLSIYYNKHKLIDLYDGKNDCVPFTSINGYTIGSFHLILKYLYIGVWVAKKQINNKFVEQKNLCLIDNLIKTREQYLINNKKIGVEPGPFKIFHTMCIGKREDIILQEYENKWDYLAKKYKKNKPE
jgi:hypothetical protein